MIIKKAYMRMSILRKLHSFKIQQSDMVNIYILYIRSTLELSCQVWHYSLTEEDSSRIERVQKVACRLILKNSYVDYETALNELKLENLHKRREILCLRFAKQCVKHPKASTMFPLKEAITTETRKKEKYVVQHTRTARLLNSAIPQLQRALNNEALKHSKKCKT